MFRFKLKLIFKDANDRSLYEVKVDWSKGINDFPKVIRYSLVIWELKRTIPTDIIDPIDLILEYKELSHYDKRFKYGTPLFATKSLILPPAYISPFSNQSQQLNSLVG